MWFIYQFVLTLFSIIVLPYAVYRAIRDPGEWKQRFGIYGSRPVEKTAGKVIWIHSSSVGEVKAAFSLMESLRNVHPGCRLILSTMTRTGQSIAKAEGTADEVIYFPLDLKWTVRRALDTFKPALFIMVETEIWPNFIREAAGRGTALMIACGRVSHGAGKRYRLFKPFFRKVLDHIDLFSMQTAVDAERIISIGADPEVVQITGSLKFDMAGSAVVSEEDCRRLRELLGFGPEDRVIVAGSTRSGEEQVILEAYKKIRDTSPGVRLVIAPRHMDRIREITRLIKSKDMNFIAFSEVSEGEKGSSAGIVLVDTIGELSRIYSMADVVFVGGSLVRVGGHNILEPAGLGKCVVFGPYMDNFREIAELFVNGGAAVQVADENGLVSVLLKLLENPAEREKLGRNAVDLIMQNQGASARNAELTRSLIKE